MKKAAWLDEFLTLIVFFPLVGAFLPWVQDFVSRGFVILSASAPAWYVGAVVTVMGWAFGKTVFPPFMAQVAGAGRAPDQVKVAR